jgi:pyruvate/2-oxoglutarate dehydrogenase complex dihydrolipoamide dehydrogenase (E3) component
VAAIYARRDSKEVALAAGGRFDVVVVGAGPGGYVGAIRAAQLGLKVAVVEEDTPGGVCLNWGCIPSKALLTGAELIEMLRAHGPTFGVSAGELRLDYGKAIDHSRKVAGRLCKGVESLLKKNAITLVRGRGRLTGPNSVEVMGPDEGVLEASHVMLATGSTEWTPPGIEVDGRRVTTSRQALESKLVPEQLVVIGAGAVGIEFAYVYANYGSQVTILEMADQMLPGADPDVAQALEREYRRKKITVRTGTRFEELKVEGNGVRVRVRSGEKEDELRADQVLVAIGRRPLSADLGLDAAAIETDDKGFVTVDARLVTSVPSVRAIGDLAGGPLLAHKASEEGVAAAEWIAGRERPEEPLYAYRGSPIEFCEVASMRMELLGNEFIEEFYSASDANRARRTHLEGIVGIFPWIATVDAFQHWIYTNPNHTRAERSAAWMALMDRFGGDVDWSGYELTRANLWHKQLHIFLYPFYYVEYGIAQLGALQVWANSRRNKAEALAQYHRALALGNSRPLPELFAAAGCRFSFDRATVQPLVQLVKNELAKLN